MKIDIKSLINQINIVDLISEFSPLTKSGSSYKTLCNVHGDKTPSLSINPRKQIYKCFVCDHGGNALDYLVWAQKFSVNDAIAYIAKSVGQEIDLSLLKKNKYNERQMQQINCLNDANNLFKYYLDIYSVKNENIKVFLNKRNITFAEIKKYGLGYAPSIDEENYANLLKKKSFDDSLLINTSLMSEDSNLPFFISRITFPIFDEDNNVIAIAGREILNRTNSIKYLHSKESLIFKKNSTIYNYQNASKYEQIIIVEGFMDVIAFNKINQDNAVALMGVSLSSAHIDKFKRHQEILVFLDNDDAGIKSTFNIVNTLIKNKINGYVLINDTNQKDPDEIVNSENGIEKLKSILINNRISFISFIYETILKTIDKKNANHVNQLLKKIKQYLEFLDSIQIDILIKKISKDLNINENIINDALNSSNVVKFIDNKPNSQTIKNEKLKVDELLNIDKMLLALYQNPSLLNVQYLENVNWLHSNATKVKLYSYLKRNYFKKEPLIDEIKIIFNDFQKRIPKHLVPKNEHELIELIDRYNNFDHQKEINKITKKKIDSNISEEEKINLLETKLQEIVKKNKE